MLREGSEDGLIELHFAVLAFLQFFYIIESSFQANKVNNMSHNEFGVTLTDGAVSRLRHLTSDSTSKHHGKKLRISIKSGGCAGLVYKYDLVETLEKNDIIVSREDIIVGVDEFSIEDMEDSQIHFDDSDFSKAAFVIINPNKCGSCSCGKSFSV